MGILNATPDSFFDGGSYGDGLDKITDRAADMVQAGAALLDVGGESTRPGALPVSIDEELSRIIPVIETINSRFDVKISVDTSKSEVAAKAMAAGADWINDISAGRFDERMPSVVSDTGAAVVLMHSRERPATMQDNPHYQDVSADVVRELNEAVVKFQQAGVKKEMIILDPGIGFAKSVNDNLTLLRSCTRLLETGYPLLIGTSRKSVIGAVTGRDVNERLAGSLATVSETYRQGARLFRVHDVAETVDLLTMIDAIYLGV